MRLRKTDAAMVIHADGEVEMHIPTIDPVPGNVLIITAIAVLMKSKDKDFMRSVRRQIRVFEKLSADFNQEG